MKKLLIFLSFAILSLGVLVSSPIKVEADYYNINWGSRNIFQSNWVLEGEVDFDLSVSSLTFQIPSSDYHTFDKGGLYPYISFSDINGDPLGTIIWADTLGDDLTALIDIDLHRFGFDDATHMYIQIPQTYGATPSGYITYIDAGATFETYVVDPSYRDTYFVYDADDPVGHTLTSDYIPVSYDTVGIALYMSELVDPIVNIIIENSNVGESYVGLYDENMILLENVKLKDHLPFLAGDDLESYRIIALGNETYDNRDIKFMVITLYVDPIVSFESVDFVNRNLTWKFSRGDVTVRWYDNGELVLEGIGFLGVFPLKFGTPLGRENPLLLFSHWIDQNGDKFPNDAFTEDMVTNDVINLYAVYTYGGIDFVYDGTPVAEPSPNIFVTLFDGIGFNDPISRTMILGIILLILTVFLIYKGLSMFTVLVIDFIILSFFVFLGLLPLFVSATITLVIGFVGWRYLGGASNE